MLSIEAKFILELIYFRNAVFKGLITVATVPDHHSNKTYWQWDNFRYPKLLYYTGMENHIRKYIVKQRVTFCCLLRKENTKGLVLPLALPTSPYHAAAMTKFG